MYILQSKCANVGYLMFTTHLVIIIQICELKNLTRSLWVKIIISFPLFKTRAKSHLSICANFLFQEQEILPKGFYYNTLTSYGQYNSNQTLIKYFVFLFSQIIFFEWEDLNNPNLGKLLLAQFSTLCQILEFKKMINLKLHSINFTFRHLNI